jgi:hypothetical protein
MNRIRRLLFIAVALLIGLFIGWQLNTYLAISIEDKELPELVPQTLDGEFPALPFRMVDLGGVGIEADPADWGDDYSHNPRRFEGVFLDEEPFVNTTAFAEAFAQYRDYIDRMAELGFIILNTDMVALTDALERYFELHKLSVEQDEFWQVYKRGLEELFDSMPVDGLIIRIGEAGSVYNLPGWDYSSELWVRSVQSVKKMLRAFLEVAEAHDKYIIFRTWSVGVGEVGAMHTDPKVYKRVLGDLHSDRLIISTKFTEGDFWNHLPLNPTLNSDRHRHKRIVELQARREYEAFNVIPNYVAPLHQVALTSFLQSNPNIEGVWVWTQSGGPLRHGPLMIYPFDGLWLWTDANVYATAKVLQDPGTPVETWTREWVRSTFGDDEEVVEKLTELLRKSHETAARGLTIPRFARKHVRGMGLDVPPVIYSYWDIVGSSTSITSLVYLVTRGHVDEAIQEGFDAVEDVRRMKQLLASVEDKIERGRDWLPQLQASLEYEENLFETMAYHKQFLLEFYQWLDTGGRSNKKEWQAALTEYERAKAVHLKRHQGDLNFPAYNFEIADVGAKQAKRTDAVIWTARALLVALVGLLAWLLKERSGPKRGVWTLVFFSVLMFGLLAAFTSFAAPVFVLTTGIPFLLYFIGLRFIVFRKVEQSAFATALLPVLILFGLILAILSIRGPFYFWFRFWTSKSFRLLLCTAGVPLVLAHFYLVFAVPSETVRRRLLIGRMCFLVGLLIALYGLLHIAVGFDEMLTLLNDELLLLPGMLSRVMGITTYLNIPLAIPTYLAAAGALLLVSGAGLTHLRR